MDLATFRRLLAAHGPDLERWPDADAAVALMAGSPEALDLLAEASAAQPRDDDAAPPDLLERILGATRKG